jgi:NADPH2:quinone reductase
MRAVLVDERASARLSLGETNEPTPAPSEALVRVSAFSLNRGEVRRAQMAEAGFKPDWDLAGIVERAADGTGPRTGARVVGLLYSGAWAELAAVPTNSLAELPAAVSFEEAATLPVAGLTALYALEKGGNLLERTVLVTGTSGGAGHFALQLARLSGTRVVALVRRKENEALVREAGAQEVTLSEDGSTAREFGPYHLVLESVGGRVLGDALTMPAPGGTCVTFGISAAAETTFDVRSFYFTGRASLYGFILFHEVLAKPAFEGLARLSCLVAEGRLHPKVSVKAPWTAVGDVARQLFDRGFTGKAVLRVED